MNSFFKNMLQRVWVLWVMLFAFTGLYANGFEGSITWVKQSIYDTTFYTYYVSNDRIRIEEKDKNKQVRIIYLINIKKEDVFIIDPNKKMYTKLKKVTDEQSNPKQFEVKKTNNYKIIKGVKCYQWRVKNVHRNCEITYWVAQNNFDFFDKMVKVLNHTDKSWEFFSSIPNSAGYFPMVYEERTLLRDKRTQATVLSIEHHQIDSSIFQIPKGYTLFVM